MGEPMNGPLREGEWGALLGEPTRLVSSLERRQVPDLPGVYLWRRDGEVVYVGMATSLRTRLWGKHLGAGTSLASSSLRRNVCELLFGIPPAVTSNPKRQKVTRSQADEIRSWLASCDLSWQACDSAEEARSLEGRLRAENLPMLNRT